MNSAQPNIKISGTPGDSTREDVDNCKESEDIDSGRH